MQPIGSLTLDQVISYGRDLTIAGTVLTVGWKLRGVWEVISDFITDIKEFMASTKLHMESVDRGMQTLLTNHVAHMEMDLRALAKAAHSEYIELATEVNHAHVPNDTTNQS